MDATTPIKKKKSNKSKSKNKMEKRDGKIAGFIKTVHEEKFKVYEVSLEWNIPQYSIKNKYSEKFELPHGLGTV